MDCFRVPNSSPQGFKLSDLASFTLPHAGKVYHGATFEDSKDRLFNDPRCQETEMKKVLCAVLLVLPFTVFGQSPFDGTWKTDMAASKLSHKPYVFAIKDGMYDCESCAPKISVKADGQDQPVTGQPYDTLAVKVTDPNTMQTSGKKAGKPTFEQTRTLSQDGKTLTVSTTSYPADGSQPFKTEAKFTRVSKGPAG